ncbi:MAG: FliG C-terminal domain-containing protein [Pseudomonadota bacterium]
MTMALPAAGPATGLPSAPPAAATQQLPVLDGPTKAAILVRLLLTEGATLSITALPEDMQADLAREIARLDRVDSATVSAVIEEFAQELAGAGFNSTGGLAEALDLLDGVIDAGLASRLRAQSGLNLRGDPWGRIMEADLEKLVPVIEAEAPEVAAVILSKLKVSKAAEILGQLPGDTARRLTYAISRTNAVTPDAVARIGRSVAEHLSIEPIVAFSDGPVERVGAILNFSRSATRQEVLNGLAETDQEFADEVRRVIFTFANIPQRIDPRDVPKILRAVDQETLIRALAAAAKDLPDVTEFFFAGISQRMATTLRSDMEELGDIAEEDAEAAMVEVVSAIRELEESGEIFLILSDE